MKIRMNMNVNGHNGPDEISSMSAAPRFTLRKRSFRENPTSVNLASYNSDFLSGLFADVAKANVLTELDIPHKRSADLISVVDVTVSASTADTSGACKRSRKSFCVQPSAKTYQSTRNLQSLFEDMSAAAAAAAVPSSNIHNGPALVGDLSPVTATVTPRTLQRHSSLAYQLQCVSSTPRLHASQQQQQQQHQSSSSSNVSMEPKTSMNIVEIAFPNLPATVSESSCSTGLSARTSLSAHSSSAMAVSPASEATPENDSKDSFGWFVDLDETSDHSPVNASTGMNISSSIVVNNASNDLAFQAPTAPKRVNDDAELEWAKAADTVDDVLGDFF